MSRYVRGLRPKSGRAGGGDENAKTQGGPGAQALLTVGVEMCREKKPDTTGKNPAPSRNDTHHGEEPESRSATSHKRMSHDDRPSHEDSDGW